MRATRRIALFVFLYISAQLHAQTTGDWGSVQRIATDQLIRVRANHHVSVCNFNSADDDSLNCTSRRIIFFVPVHSSLDFRRTEVQSVKLSRQSASALLGTAIGAGGGAGIGAGIDASAKSQEDSHLATAVMALLGGLVGAGIGRHTDFFGGPTIYQAP